MDATSLPDQENQEAIDVNSRMRWFVLSGVWLLYFSFGLGVFSLAPLVSTIVQELAMTHAQMGMVLGTWQFVFIFSAIPCGFLIGVLGPRKSLMLAAALIAASCLLRSFAQDFVSLMLAVALFGIGGPLISVGAPFVAARWFEGSARGLAVGIYVTGPPVGALVTYSLSNSVLMPFFDNNWRHVLVIWGMVAIVAGIYWLAVSLIAGQGPRGKNQQSNQFARIGEIMTILRGRDVQLLLAISIGVFVYNHGMGNWLPEILRSSGMSAKSAGYWSTVPVIIATLGALIIPRLAIPERRIFILAGLVFAAGCSSLLLSTFEPVLRVPALVLQGLAVGSIMAVLTLVLVESPHVGPRRAGLASGLFFSVAEIGGMTGPLALGIFFDTTGGFVAGLYFLVACAAILLVLVALLQRNLISNKLK